MRTFNGLLYLHDTPLGVISDDMFHLVSLFPHALDEHERQDDVVQHVHSCRLHLESRLAFLGEMLGSAKLSDHGLPLVGSDQLHTTIEYNVNVEGLDGVSGSVPWDNKFLLNPSPTYTERHLAQ